MRPNRTWLCPACALRFEPSQRCPRCAGAVLDLSQARGRARASAALREPTLLSRLIAPFRISAGCATALVLTFIIIATFAGMFLGAFLLGAVGWMAGFFLVPIVLTVIWALAFPGSMSGWQPRQRLQRRSVELWPAPRASKGAQRFHGRIVEAESALSAPLSGRSCVAYRILGHADGMPLDEADAVPFVLETPEGTAIEVDPRPATIDVPVEDASPVSPLSPALTRFLEPRGVLASAPVELAEARIAVGDWVEVEAFPIEQRRASGYRGRERVLLLRESPDQPLVLRRSAER